MTTKKLVLAALLVSISVLGSFMKIFGTIALDSLPAFLGGLILGPIIGGIIGLLGHLLTALTSGFPFGLPIHLIISFGMFVTVYSFTVVYNKINKLKFILPCMVAVFINGPLLLLIVSRFLGMETFFALIVPLSIVSLVNSLGGIVIFTILKKRKIINNGDIDGK